MSLLDLLTSTEPNVLTVSKLTSSIRELLEGEFFDIWVEGEISNFKKYPSGHWYFTLKDAQAQLRCAAFRNNNMYIRFRPEDGLKVRARGHLSVYDPRGEYQLLVSNIEPVGKGSLQLAFEQLKESLTLEGFFDEDRKKPLPRFPKLIAIVTSPQGAVVHDILNILKRRNRTVDVLVYPVRVQGETAAPEIVAALDYLNTLSNIDTIIVGRGGGSIEDLWPFNEEIVVRAIARSKIPVISAVGHETDITLTDFVADFRASTPSAAAEIVAIHQDEISGLINGYLESIQAAFTHQLLRKRNQLSSLQSSRSFDSVQSMIHRYNQHLDNTTYRLETATRNLLKEKSSRAKLLSLKLDSYDLKERLESTKNRLKYLQSRLKSSFDHQLEQAQEKLTISSKQLQALSPIAVLERGYAIVRNSKGEVISRASDIKSGEPFWIRFSDGEIKFIKE
ncbi:MAG: exodeoxyribonuclease VII large subunit [Blastocatellia bacterium]|nr:exodeoxyribonuclease VII large subunit [Blastocatellia bacterium]